MSGKWDSLHSLDGVVEGAFLLGLARLPLALQKTCILQIRNHNMLEPVVSSGFVHVLHPLALVLIAGCASDGVAPLEEVQRDPAGDVAASSSDQYFYQPGVPWGCLPVPFFLGTGMLTRMQYCYRDKGRDVSMHDKLDKLHPGWCSGKPRPVTEGITSSVRTEKPSPYFGLRSAYDSQEPGMYIC